MRPLRDALLLIAGSERVRDLVTSLPVSGSVVRGYVPGESAEEVVAAVAALAEDGIDTTIDYLGEDTLDPERARATVDAYREMLAALSAAGLAERAEVSVKLTALGLRLPEHGEQTALANARAICLAARNAGTMVTVDMEDHTTTDVTIALVRELRQDFPETGVVLQAYLRRTEADCRRLSGAGSRVRLCKGAYDEPADVAFTVPAEVDRSYVRCLKTLLAGQGYPMIATHDPRLIRIADALAQRYGRRAESYEFQMLYGVRPVEQRRLAEAGQRVRVYVPYGEEWYGYLVRRLAERPRNLTLFVTSLISKK
ncbi:proline dehydrogenase [Nocardioides sp. GY 10113]|uniref:proline dehydrogenase family protein n=1 Tax=Nocardioides sp. GY 10113 TaxID=2569761 RepID=UPI0010A8F15B|nr:proline dehydrogenase family protein [Nocardioides sp. GY 10113]TIC89240.1 proline dehydrogenase [Nocardioides sp. GY 10113]